MSTVTCVITVTPPRHSGNRGRWNKARIRNIAPEPTRVRLDTEYAIDTAIVRMLDEMASHLHRCHRCDTSEVAPELLTSCGYMQNLAVPVARWWFGYRTRNAVEPDTLFDIDPESGQESDG